LKLDKLSELELLALLSASSVLRKEKYFDSILEVLLIKKYSVKKIYEALLQTYLFAGFPSALISLKRLSEIAGKDKVYKGYDLKKYLSRGEKNCRIIYGNKYDKLIANVKSFSPEMAEWLIVEGYGKVLGRKGLTLKEREVCIVSILSALKFKDQLYSHINGAVQVNAGFNLILKTIKNLELISAKTSVKFGLNVFEEYQLKKTKNTFRSNAEIS
jgi:alkylhydroperoxidase/carboxymuconolactone decarboxylase family protein YurZ